MNRCQTLLSKLTCAATTRRDMPAASTATTPPRRHWQGTYKSLYPPSCPPLFIPLLFPLPPPPFSPFLPMSPPCYCILIAKRVAGELLRTNAQPTLCFDNPGSRVYQSISSCTLKASHECTSNVRFECWLSMTLLRGKAHRGASRGGRKGRGGGRAWQIRHRMQLYSSPDTSLVSM